MKCRGSVQGRADAGTGSGPGVERVITPTHSICPRMLCGHPLTPLTPHRAVYAEKAEVLTSKVSPHPRLQHAADAPAGSAAVQLHPACVCPPPVPASPLPTSAHLCICPSHRLHSLSPCPSFSPIPVLHPHPPPKSTTGCPSCPEPMTEHGRQWEG